MKTPKILPILIISLLSNSCYETVKFDVANMYYLDHMTCGTKQYGIFDVSYNNIKNFPKLWTDTMTVDGKLYVNVVLIEMPDTLTGNYYGADYYEVNKTKADCKELQYLHEIGPLRNFYFKNKNKPFIPS